jgi:hypothetical protein
MHPALPNIKPVGGVCSALKIGNTGRHLKPCADNAVKLPGRQ